MSKRAVKDFLGKPAPAGYVAGAGRVGFTTRPDAGGETASAIGLDPEAAGDDAGLLAGQHSSLDPEDTEADRIYAAIEATMAARRRSHHRALRPQQQQQQQPKAQKSLQTAIFQDLKPDLERVSEAEWNAIPEAGDRRTKRTKRPEPDRFTPVPDSVIMGGLERGMAGTVQDAEDPSGTLIRERVLGSTLDRLAAPKHQQLPNKYLDDLSRSTVLAGQQAVDLDRAKTIMRGIVQGNPGNPAGWIAAARLEEVSGRVKSARALLLSARTGPCRESEDVWLESLRLWSGNVEEFRKLAEEGLKVLPKRPLLWLRIANLEPDVMLRKRIVRRGLAENPKSADLWRLMCSLEPEPDDKRALLAKACELCPDAVDLFIELAELEVPENAKKLFNRALASNPQNLELWIAAARLETDRERCQLIVDMATSRCQDVTVERLLEFAKDDMASKLFLRKVLPRDQLASYDTDNPILQSVICELLVDLDSSNETAWLKLVERDKSMFERAIAQIPTSERLWSVRIDMESNPQAKKDLLQRAMLSLQNDEFAIQAAELTDSVQEKIRLLTCAKSQTKRIDFELAKLLDDLNFLEGACQRHPTYEPLWLLLTAHAPQRLPEALTKCPQGVRLWMRALDRETSPAAIRALHERAARHNPKNELLWTCMLRKDPQNARLLCARALQECPKSGVLLAEAVWLEARPLRKARAMDALRKAPTSGLVIVTIARLLWAERKYAEADVYFEKAQEVDPDCADSYAYYYKFCKDASGYEQNSEAIVQRYASAKPKVSSLCIDLLEFSWEELLKRAQSAVGVQ